MRQRSSEENTVVSYFLAALREEAENGLSLQQSSWTSKTS